MINIRNLDDRTYEELLQEALMEIPLYTEEWTNYNPSDPGITILENLTAFEILQQNRINEITGEVRRNLLKLAGFEQSKGKCSRVLLKQENLEESISLTANQKFHLGDLCFETNRATTIYPWNITKIFSVTGDKRKEFTFLTEREVDIPVSIFGDHPKEGDAVYFVTDGLPKEEEEIIFWITAANRHNRNAFVEKGKSRFASLKWECLTETGFQEMKVKDFTGCFLVSGEIKMRVPTGAVMIEEENTSGYVIRATLTRAEYDVRPRLLMVEGFLFEAFQKKTLSACYSSQKSNHIRVKSDLLKEGYLLVFGKEEKGSSYRKYEPSESGNRQGRYFDIAFLGEDEAVISFDKKKYKYGPDKLKAPVKILLYNEEIMRKYSLGKVEGYDRQTMKLPVENIVPETFTILAVRKNEEDDEIYDFVRPGYDGPKALGYHLYEKEGIIEIVSSGEFIGADLYMCSVSTTAGPEGNIRKGSYLKTWVRKKELLFYNPSEGTDGKFRESLKETEERFFKDLYQPYTAITAKDYEEIVKQTPELCIHKVKAFMNEERNMVKIVVKPGTDEELPQLSPIYSDAIYKYLEEKRLLTTKIILKDPQYVPIDIHGTIYINSKYKDARKKIEEAIHQQIDYIHSDKSFGDILKFDDLFYAIQQLECVEFIYDLHMTAQKPGLVTVREPDIHLSEECLCYVGNLYLDIGTYGK